MGTYKIADLIVQMDSFGRVMTQAAPYACEEQQPDLVIRSDAKAFMERNPHLSLEDCEYLATGGSFYRQLLHFGGMMLHASCVVVDGKAYLFSAPCGTGKSTHVRLWLCLFGDRAYILNDDKPALRFLDGKVFVYGTPWSGKDDCSRNARAELGGIAVVRRAAENTMRRLTTEEAVFCLMDQTARSVSAQAQMQCLDMIDRLIQTGKIWELSCNMDISAARLSYETMSGERFEHED